MATIADVLGCYIENEKIYGKLTDDVNCERVVPFVGAGLSAAYYPTWIKFLKNIIESEGKSHEEKVDSMLSDHRFEEAASYIQEVLGEMRFYDRMQDTFSDKKLQDAEVTIILQLVCILFHKSIITTNFDHVLKWAYEKMENPFVEIVTPRRELDLPAIDRIWRQHSLIKLHGSISKEEDIVITKEDYDSVYGDSILIDVGTAFTKLLETIYTNNVLLFLGCSLEADRTMKVLEMLLRNQKRDQYHYAFMELPKETENVENPYEPIYFKDGDKLSVMADLERSLSNRKIRVIWFPYGKYEAIELLLDGLCNHTKRKSIEKADLSISKYGIKTISSFFINQAVTDIPEELQKYMQDFFCVDTSWKTLFSVVCNNLDIPFAEVNDKLKELIKKKRKRILLTGYAGIGKSTMMLRSAVEFAKQGRSVYWLNLAEASNSQQDYENMVRYIHNSGFPKIPAILFIDNPYYGRHEMIKLRKVFSGGQKNIQIVMFDRIQRLYELTYENDDYLQNWFDNADIIIVHSHNNRNDHYDFLENSLVAGSYAVDYSMSHIPQNKEWIKSVITNFIQKRIRGFRSEDLRLVDKILEKEDLYSCSIVEIQYHLLFVFTELGRKAYSKSAIDCLMDWDEWANRLVNWNIVSENDSFEYYQFLAVFGLFNIMTDIDDYVDFHTIPQKKRQIIQKLNMMIGEYNIEPIRFLPNANKIGPKHDIICELFFSFNIRWKEPLKILFPYIKQMDAGRFTDFVNSVHLYIRNYNYHMYRNFNWIELVQTLIEAPAYELIKDDNRMCVKIIQCMFWSYINEDDLNSAYSYLKEQLYDELFRDNIHLLYDFASLCVDLEFFEEAIEVLEHAVEMNAFHIPSKMELGRLYLQYKLDFPKSRQLFEDILSMNPRHSAARRYLAKVLDKQGLYRDAENQYNLALGYNADDYKTLVEYGNHYILLKHEDKAIEKYNESLQVMPDNRPASIALGRIYMRQGSYDKAKKYFKKALRRRNMDLDILFYLSELYIKENKPEDAINLYESKGQNWSDYTAYQAAYGKLYQRLGRDKEAVRKYRQALEISPTNSQALRGLTKIYIDQNDLIAAENLLKKTFQHFSDRPHILRIYVEFLENTGQDENVSKLLDSYIDFAKKHDSQNAGLRKEDMRKLAVPERKEDMRKLTVPDKLEDILPLEELYRELNMYDEAYGLLKIARERFKNNVDVLRELGEVCCVQKKDEEAVQLFEELLKLQPEDQIACARLAQIYVENGNTEKAYRMLFGRLESKKNNKIDGIRRKGTKRKQGKEKRLPEFHKAFLDTDNLTNEYNLLHIAEIVKEMPNEKDKLIRFLNDAIYKNPKKFYLNNILIEYYGNQGMYYEARGLYHKTVRIHKNPISTHLTYERVCVKAGKITEAIAVCRETLNYYPDQLKVQSEYARLLVQDHKVDEAKKVLEKAVEPDYTREIYSQLLRLYCDLGESEKIRILVSWIMNHYKYDCQELVAALQFFVANKIEIQNNNIEYVLQNFVLTYNQKRIILKIFEQLYKKYKVKTLYEKIISINVDERKKINVLYLHYKEISGLGSEEAIWSYALKLSPKDTFIIQSLIKLYMDQKGIDCALDFMEQYYSSHAELAPVAVEYYRLLKDCEMTEKKQEVLEQALSINPDSVVLLEPYVKCCRDVGNIERMITALRRLTEIRPDNLDYTCRLADAYICFGDHESAKQVYLNYLEERASGQVSAANLCLADLYMQEEKFELAYQQLVLLIDQKYCDGKARNLNYSEFIKWGMENMDYTSMTNFIGWLNKNQCVDAVSIVYELKIERNVQDISAYYYIGTLYDDLCQFEKAAWYLEEGLKHADDKIISAGYFHKAASVCRKLRFYDKALGFYQKELAIKESFYGYSGLGLLHIWIGRLDEAEAYLVKAVKMLLHKPSPSVYLNFGILKLYQNKYDEAENLFMSSSKLLCKYGKKPIKAYYWLARLYSKLGRESQACSYLERVSRKEMDVIEDIDKEIFLSKELCMDD